MESFKIAIRIRTFLLFSTVILLAQTSVIAIGSNKDPQAQRKKALSFENDVVEARGQLDSLKLFNNQDRRRHGHLYRKRTQFKSEMRQTVRDIGYSP